MSQQHGLTSNGLPNNTYVSVQLFHIYRADTDVLHILLFQIYFYIEHLLRMYIDIYRIWLANWHFSSENLHCSIFLFGILTNFVIMPFEARL